MGALHRCTVFDPDNRSALVHKAAGYCSKLLKRPDQCRAVLACSHLYWQEPVAGAAGGAAAVGAVALGAEEGAAEAEADGDEAGSVAYLTMRDATGVLSCLKRALKIANAAQQQLAVAARAGDAGPAFLFVEILNHYLYYFDHGCELVTTAVLQVGAALCTSFRGWGLATMRPQRMDKRASGGSDGWRGSGLACCQDWAW